MNIFVSEAEVEINNKVFSLSSFHKGFSRLFVCQYIEFVSENKLPIYALEN